MFKIASPAEVDKLARQSFSCSATCTSQRKLTEILPPKGSETARRIYAKVAAHSEVVHVAFVDSAAEKVISCYDSLYKTVFIRADKKYIYTEYTPEVEMPFVVLLYHEFGHAKQYLVDGSGERLLAEDSSLTYTGGNKPGWEGTTKVMKPIRGDITQFNMHGYAANIETNNMRLHEWPICRELGIPVRSRYTDIREGAVH